MSLPSTVYLLDTPLDNTYKNQLNFTSVSAQASYFLGRLKHTFDNVTYQRKTSTIKVNKNIDALGMQLCNVSYLISPISGFMLLLPKWNMYRPKSQNYLLKQTFIKPGYLM